MAFTVQNIELVGTMTRGEIETVLRGQRGLLFWKRHLSKHKGAFYSPSPTVSLPRPPEHRSKPLSTGSLWWGYSPTPNIRRYIKSVMNMVNMNDDRIRSKLLSVSGDNSKDSHAAFTSVYEIAAEITGLLVRLKCVLGTHTVTVAWGGYGKCWSKNVSD